MVSQGYNDSITDNTTNMLRHEIEALEKRVSTDDRQSMGNNRAAQMNRSRLASRRQQLETILERQRREKVTSDTHKAG